ncbi:nuclear pore complex protein NUP62-like [Heterocephalus glaber]|uniref:Nuclear pore complex protein NUP62-like n=1 Tax=Heterocephalus glaber TaxID=10181 RepID=A0AAX6SUB5_HETGA|nr:nuclear pore complex protein NUP62-like [Heterocephalus glaber]
MTPSSGSTASAREASTLPALRFFRMATHEKNPIESASSNQLTLGATDGQQHGHTPPPGMLHFGDLKAITLGPTSTSGQLVLSSTTQAAPGGSLHTNMTSGTGASNQMVSSVTQSLSSPGTSIASASATTMGIHDLVQLVSSVIQCLSSSGISIASASPIATHMPNAMTHIQDNRQLQSTLVNRSPDTGTLAVSATPNGSERKELPADFISSFEALTISSTKRGTSSTTRHYGGSMGLSTGGPASHSSLVVSMGPSTMKNSVHGDHRAPVLSSVPTSPLKQKRSNSSGEPSDMTSKAASKCKPKPASKFGIRATHEAKVRRKLVFRATSSSAQASGLTTPAAATESSSCSSEPTVDSKRPKMP